MSEGYFHILWSWKKARPGMFWANTRDHWYKQVSLARYNQVRTPIECSICGKPAIFLDGLYPYDIEYNRCEEHDPSVKTA